MIATSGEVDTSYSTGECNVGLFFRLSYKTIIETSSKPAGFVTKLINRKQRLDLYPSCLFFITSPSTSENLPPSLQRTMTSANQPPKVDDNVEVDTISSIDDEVENASDTASAKRKPSKLNLDVKDQDGKLIQKQLKLNVQNIKKYQARYDRIINRDFINRPRDGLVETWVSIQRFDIENSIFSEENWLIKDALDRFVSEVSEILGFSNFDMIS